MVPHEHDAAGRGALQCAEVTIDPPGLPGDLRMPRNPAGLVIFAHGSGSSRKSPRNAYVADGLGVAGFATLLIVGGEDREVLRLNREAYGALRCEKELLIVPGATHLFEEPGALDHVIDGARDWFARHLQVENVAAGNASG